MSAPRVRAAIGLTPTRKVAKNNKARVSSTVQMRVHPSSGAEDRTPTSDPARALPGARVRADVPDLRASILPTDSLPAGLEPPLRVDRGHDEPRAWSQGEPRAAIVI